MVRRASGSTKKTITLPFTRNVIVFVPHSLLERFITMKWLYFPKRFRAHAGLLCLGASLCLLTVSLSGCGKSEASSTRAPGISPQQFADGVHAVMMADRTVYAKHVVTNLKKQNAPVSADEYWDQSENAIPLPAQMFRMGAELVDKNPEAGFTYSLRSQWPLNDQHKPQTELEQKALEFLSENPGENFYSDEELGGKKYFVAVYPDRAVAEACWTCHNEHSNKGDDYPEFAEGDVMGGVLVRIPIQ